MQVVVNERFLSQRARLSRWATYGGVALLVVAYLPFVLQLIGQDISNWADPVIVSYGTMLFLFAGFIAYSTGQMNKVRWTVRPREEEILVNALQGFDHRYKLLNYMPQTPGVYHVLLGPAGVYVIHVRRQDGEIVNHGDKWQQKGGLLGTLRSLFTGSFGNPTQDAQRETQAVRKVIAAQFAEEDLDQLTIQPLIVFIDTRAKLTLSEPAVPAMMTRELKDFMRKQRRESRLNGNQLQKIAAAYGLA